VTEVTAICGNHHKIYVQQHFKDSSGLPAKHSKEAAEEYYRRRTGAQTTCFDPTTAAIATRAAYPGVGSAWTQFKWNSDALLETDDVIAPKPAFADLVARPGFLPGNFFEVFALLNGLPYEWIKGVS